MNKSLIVLRIQIQIQLNSKEMQLEQDNKGYSEDKSKWTCHYCLWEKSEFMSENLFSNPGSRVDTIVSTSYFLAFFMPPNEHPLFTSHSLSLFPIWPLLLTILLKLNVKQVEVEGQAYLDVAIKHFT